MCGVGSGLMTKRFIPRILYIMSFPSAFRLRDRLLLAKKADKSGWATGMQETAP